MDTGARAAGRLRRMAHFLCDGGSSSGGRITDTTTWNANMYPRGRAALEAATGAPDIEPGPASGLSHFVLITLMQRAAASKS